MTQRSVTPEAKTGPRSRWSGWAINVSLILFAFICIQWWQTRPMASGKAPDLSGQLLSGMPFELSSLEGKPVLVHFWATWCPVCKMGEGNIAQLAHGHEVITVAMQSGDPTEIGAYLSERDLAFPVLPDPYGEIASAWGVQGVPVNFILDASGTIHSSTVGYTTKPGIEARLWAARHLGAKAQN